MLPRLIAFGGVWAGLLGLGLLWFAASGSLRQASGFTMGTTWSAQWVARPWREPGFAPAAEFDELLAHLDRQVFSTYAADSEVSRLNAQPVGAAMPLSGELFEVLRLSREIAALTGGAFDATAGALVDLWGFGPGNPLTANSLSNTPRIPFDEEIRKALEHIGADRIALDPTARAATRLGEAQVDLSAVAKGYAVDRMAALLEARGVTDYFLEIGGELKIGGRKPGFQPWRAALEAPAPALSPGAVEIHAVISNRGENFAVAGAGNYRNFFQRDGVRYSHHIDPRTGHPVQHELAAAYVIDPSTARADALATAFMVLGLAESRAFAERHTLPVYLIYANESGGWSHYASPAFTRYQER